MTSARKCVSQGADSAGGGMSERGIPRSGPEPLPDLFLMDNRYYPSNTPQDQFRSFPYARDSGSSAEIVFDDQLCRSTSNS